MEEKKALWDAEEGEELGPIEFDVTPEVVGAWNEAVGDYNPWFVSDSPFGGRVMDPSESWVCKFRLSRTKFGRRGPWAIMAYNYDVENVNPAIVGKKLTLTGKITNKFVKRDRIYLDMVVNAVDEDGQEIFRHKDTFLLRYLKLDEEVK